MNKPAENKPKRPRRINWAHVSTVLSAAILIGAEVFGAAYVAGWAFALLFGLGDYTHYGLQAVFFITGMVVMVAFVRAAARIEPFTSRG
jgi:hypothetical protein